MLKFSCQATRCFKYVACLGLLLGVLFFHSGPALAQNEDTATSINTQIYIAGKALKRAADFLDWTLGLYRQSASDVEGFSFLKTEMLSGTDNNVLYTLWFISIRIVVIVYLVIAVVIAFGFMFRARWLDRWKRHIPWLIVSAILAGVSYAVLRVVMSTFAAAMYPFLKNIEASQLLSVGYDYDSVTGVVSNALSNQEIIANTISLLKISTYTAYAIGGMLLLRTSVIWLLVVFSPFIFPTLSFPVTQPIARLWLKELLRFLLYGPLVAMFLYASSQIWSAAFDSNAIQSDVGTGSSYGSGTEFNIGTSNTSISSTTSSGGTLGSSFTQDEYARYIIAVIMLWVSIILPWLLLRFSLNAVSEAGSKWYERNRDNAILKQVERFVGPAPAQPNAPPGTGASKPFEGIVASNQRAIEEVAAKRYDSSTDALRNVSTSTMMQLSGLRNLSSLTKNIEASRQSTMPLSNMARLEQSADIEQAKAEIDRIQHPDQASSEVERRKIADIQNSIAAGQTKTDVNARRLNMLVRGDYSSIASQNINLQALNKTLASVENTARDLLTSGQVKDGQTQTQLKQMMGLVGQYKSSNKDSERSGLLTQIKEMSKTIAEKPESIPVASTINMAAGGTGLKSQNRILDPGRALIKSLQYLNVSDLSTISTEQGLQKLMSDQTEISDIVPDVETINDYEASKEQWHKYYLSAQIPVSQTITNREQWINTQLASHEKILGQLVSSDDATRKAGLKELSEIMPFMLMGDYSMLEIVLYLKGKIAGGKSALSSIKGETPPAEKEKIEVEKISQSNTAHMASPDPQE